MKICWTRNSETSKTVDMEETLVKKQTSVRRILDPIILNISWAEISKEYFGKSRSWLYQKFTGYNGHAETDFTEKERNIMKNALYDLAEKIRYAADNI